MIKRRILGPVLAFSGVLLFASAGAAASFESGTVSSFWQGLWWSVSLMTTVGFINGPPRTVVGAVLSALLMVVGFVLLALMSAGLASLFVKEETDTLEAREQDADAHTMAALDAIRAQLAAIESRLPAAEPSTATGLEPREGSSGAGPSAAGSGHEFDR